MVSQVVATQKWLAIPNNTLLMLPNCTAWGRGVYYQEPSVVQSTVIHWKSTYCPLQCLLENSQVVTGFNSGNLNTNFLIQCCWTLPESSQILHHSGDKFEECHQSFFLPEAKALVIHLSSETLDLTEENSTSILEKVICNSKPQYNINIIRLITSLSPV